MTKIDNAIIMAAGKGERLRPLTLETPKPLVLINNKPIIESIIEGLLLNNIKDIYIVVGYLKDKFEYLVEKYQCITLIENPYYETYNNLSSLYVTANYLKNTLIIDGDQIVNNPKILNNEIVKSSYCAIYTKQKTNEWLLQVENNHIYNCLREGGDNGYQLFGISKWLEKDTVKLKQYVINEFNRKNFKIYWDDIALNIYKNDFDLGIEIISHNDVIEIDTIDDYYKMTQID